MMAISFLSITPIPISIAILYFFLDVFYTRYQMIYIFKKGPNE